MGKATERIFMPLIRTQLPELVDMNLPLFGVFHNFALVSIDKRYPYHAKKIMHSLWGLGQLMFSKIIIVVDKDVDVQNVDEVLFRVGSNVDPKRDVTIVEGPVDVLDHAAPLMGAGSKEWGSMQRPNGVRRDISGSGPTKSRCLRRSSIWWTSGGRNTGLTEPLNAAIFALADKRKS